MSEQNATDPIGSVHGDTLSMAQERRHATIGGAKLWPASKAKYDAAYVLVYAAPTPAAAGLEPLTDEQIEKATGANPATPIWLVAHAFTRAVEAAHGIGAAS